jgi:RNA polymerase sigma-70 factor (ECF subfamily)
MAEPAGLENALEQCRGGDPVGFSAIYRCFGRPLFGTALRILGRPEDAEEVVQEAFIRFFRSGTGLTAEHLPRWLRRVVVNQCLDRIRRSRTRNETSIEESRTADMERPEGMGLDLIAAVDRLPDRARLIFLMHDVEGFKHREIAEILGLSEGSTKSQLFRARELIRTRLRPAARETG